MVNQSYIGMLNGWCLVVCPLVSRGTFGPLCDSGCVLTEEVDTWWCWQSGDVVSMYLPLSLPLLCMFFGLAEITGLSGGKCYMTSQIAWLRKLDCSPLSHKPHHKMRPPQTLFGQSHFTSNLRWLPEGSSDYTC